MTDGPPDAPHPADDGRPGPVGPALRRGRRRAVRRGTGDPEPSVGLRAADDLDVGWQPPAEDTDDDRLRRDVPPHW